MPEKEEKRRYRRVNAPVYFSYTPLLSRPAAPRDISPGGLRMYSDEKIQEGKLLDLTITLSDGRFIECRGQVIWAKKLPPGSPAKYDIGLGFLALSKADEEILSEYLADY